MKNGKMYVNCDLDPVQKKLFLIRVPLGYFNHIEASTKFCVKASIEWNQCDYKLDKSALKKRLRFSYEITIKLLKMFAIAMLL